MRRGVSGGRLLVAGRGERIRRLESAAARADVPVERVDPEELTRIGGAKARGAVLVSAVREGGVALAEAVGELHGDNAVVLVLDGITDPHNLGAVLRSADQFAVDLVVVPERRSASLGDTVARTSAGADQWVRVSVVPNLRRALEELKRHEFWVYGAAANGRPAHDIDLSGRVAVVLGREGEGLHRLVRESCDELIAIPTTGHIDSLNVSVAAGILLYEVRRQGGFPEFR